MLRSYNWVKLSRHHLSSYVLDFTSIIGVLNKKNLWWQLQNVDKNQNKGNSSSSASYITPKTDTIYKTELFARLPGLPFWQGQLTAEIIEAVLPTHPQPVSPATLKEIPVNLQYQFCSLLKPQHEGEYQTSFSIANVSLAEDNSLASLPFFQGKGDGFLIIILSNSY